MPKLFECSRCGATFERMGIDTPELCYECAVRRQVEEVLERASAAAAKARHLSVE
jgi:DNA-directed RNA polymerase subunit RPC12/RpoP